MLIEGKDVQIKCSCENFSIKIFHFIVIAKLLGMDNSAFQFPHEVKIDEYTSKMQTCKTRSWTNLSRRHASFCLWSQELPISRLLFYIPYRSAIIVSLTNIISTTHITRKRLLESVSRSDIPNRFSINLINSESHISVSRISCSTPHRQLAVYTTVHRVLASDDWLVLYKKQSVILCKWC